MVLERRVPLRRRDLESPKDSTVNLAKLLWVMVEVIKYVKGIRPSIEHHISTPEAIFQQRDLLKFGLKLEWGSLRDSDLMAAQIREV